jgi:predicted Zn-dependent protease with MMP-like domain
MTLEEYRELQVGDRVKVLTLAEREGTIKKTRSFADGWALVDMGTFTLNVNHQEMLRAANNVSNQEGRPETWGIWVRRAEFTALVELALKKIPAQLRAAMDNIGIVIEDWPDEELMAEMDGDSDAMVYGIYQGIPLPERGASYGNTVPDVIVLYQKALEEDFPEREELISEIEITLVHEIGHYFGFDESELEKYGYDWEDRGTMSDHRRFNKGPHRQNVNRGVSQQNPRRNFSTAGSAGSDKGRKTSIDPFELFCAYHLGIGEDKTYRPANIHDVARRFGVDSGEIRQALQIHGMGPETMFEVDFDLTMAQLDIQVAPEGVDRKELARTIYQEFRGAPRRKRDWQRILAEDDRENTKTFGRRWEMCE